LLVQGQGIDAGQLQNMLQQAALLQQLQAQQSATQNNLLQALQLQQLLLNARQDGSGVHSQLMSHSGVLHAPILA
jgi:hypothetical protein